MTLVPSRAISWLSAPVLGRPVWTWLACLAAVLVAVLWLRAPLLALVPAWLFLLVRPAARVPAPSDRDDPSPAALDAHSAALETDRALAHVGEEARARAALARHAAQTDPLDEVVARIEDRARRNGGQ